MRRLAAIALLGLVGCMDGPDEDTLVDVLRVMAIVAEPPEVAPTAELGLEVVVADPVDGGAELLVWLCTPAGEGCLEGGSEHLWTPAVVGGQATVTTTAPAALAALASEEPIRATLVWALACEPGLCPQIGDPTAWDLVDPTSWMRELPFDGVSLALSTLAVSTRDDPHQNPTLARAGDEEIRVGAGESTELSFAVGLSSAATPDTLAFGYATGGGFDATEYSVGDDGEVALTWFAPDEAGEVVLYVIVNDGAGGSAVWTGEAVVE